MTPIRKILPKIALFSAALVISLGLFSSYSTKHSDFKVSVAADSDSDSGSDTGTGGSDDGSGLYLDHPSSIACPQVTFIQNTYYSSSGSVVGKTLIENGVVIVNYTGAYAKFVTTSGTIAAHTGTANACYTLCLACYCTTITAVEACQ